MSDPMIRVCLWLPANVWDGLKQDAKAAGTSAAELVRATLESHYKREEHTSEVLNPVSVVKRA
jgi:hypothetical protein